MTIGVSGGADRNAAADNPKHSDKRDCGDGGLKNADGEIDRRIGGNSRIVGDAAFGDLMVSRHQVELVIATVGEPIAYDAVDNPGAPLALHLHASVDRNDCEHNGRGGERKENAGLRENGRAILLLNRVEQIAVPHIQPVLDRKLNEDEDHQADREEPRCRACILEPIAAGGRPETVLPAPAAMGSNGRCSS